MTAPASIALFGLGEAGSEIARNLVAAAARDLLIGPRDRQGKES